MRSSHWYPRRRRGPSRDASRVADRTIAPGERAASHAERPVLIVEDDPTQRELLAELFAKHGHSVATAASGGAALAMLWAGLDARLVVIDLAMPEMSGEAFCATLQLDPQLDGVEVVLYSARGDLEEVARRLRVPFVAKPYAADLLPFTARHG